MVDTEGMVSSLLGLTWQVHISSSSLPRSGSSCVHVTRVRSRLILGIPFPTIDSIKLNPVGFPTIDSIKLNPDGDKSGQNGERHKIKSQGSLVVSTPAWHLNQQVLRYTLSSHLSFKCFSFQLCVLYGLPF